MNAPISYDVAMIDVSRRWPLSAVHADPLPRHTAWRRSDVTEADWLLAIPDACLAEIDAIVRSLREHPIPTLVLTPAEFEMPQCRHLGARLKAVLDSGIGFAVVDRLPVEAYSKEELLAVYWLFSQMLARPVAQAFKGTLLYDGHDTGKKTDTRVRADLTNEDLSWHTDHGFDHPPPYVGLLVLRTALSGGVSSAGSLYTAHEVLRERDPRLLRRLYEPTFGTDRVNIRKACPSAPATRSSPFTAVGFAAGSIVPCSPSAIGWSAGKSTRTVWTR